MGLEILSWPGEMIVDLIEFFHSAILFFTRPRVGSVAKLIFMCAEKISSGYCKISRVGVTRDSASGNIIHGPKFFVTFLGGSANFGVKMYRGLEACLEHILEDL